jgi:hypothetical protein
MDCNGFSFDPGRPGLLWRSCHPRAAGLESVQRRRIVEAFSSWTYRLDLPGEDLRDGVGLSPVSEVSHCGQVTPCTTLGASERS